MISTKRKIWHISGVVIICIGLLVLFLAEPLVTYCYRHSLFGLQLPSYIASPLSDPVATGIVTVVRGAFGLMGLGAIVIAVSFWTNSRRLSGDAAGQVHRSKSLFHVLLLVLPLLILIWGGFVWWDETASGQWEATANGVAYAYLEKPNRGLFVGGVFYPLAKPESQGDLVSIRGGEMFYRGRSLAFGPGKRFAIVSHDGSITYLELPSECFLAVSGSPYAQPDIAALKKRGLWDKQIRPLLEKRSGGG
ncbi:MAG: hypothetical protein LLG01_08620 [Planctomycetaceae bacterium]|nr:hypothetical protein [Planctomycetaceae bacterium]